MALDHLSSFFRRFQNVTAPDESVRKVFSAVIKEKVGVMVGVENISVKSGEILVKTNPAIKNELFMRKQDILAEVNMRTGKKLVNIR
jgi:hypothetical protein